MPYTKREIYLRARIPSRFEIHRLARPAPVFTPDMLRPSDLRHGLDALRTEAALGSPSATAVLHEIDRLRGMLAMIPRRARSKHSTHEWTGRRWRARTTTTGP